MKKHTTLLFLLISFCLNAQLKINEIMSNNVSAHMDDTKNYSMWVEVYNPIGGFLSNQYNYYFTDDKSEPKKWRPYSKMIPAGTYSILWFERDEQSGHCNFKLKPEGGKLYLMNVSGVAVDSVVYPSQLRNISYGRKTDGDPEWVFFEKYSPGTTNNGRLWSNERCGKPVFHLSSGFYTGSQDLNFDDPAPNDSIYYSLNGSEPSRLSSYYVPGSTINLLSTTVVRAACFSKEKLSSAPVTQTFLVNEHDPRLPIVSIVTTPDNLTSNTIGIYISGTGSTPNYNQNWQRPAHLELIDTSKVSCISQEIDVSISGAYTRTFAQKTLRLSPGKKFGDGQFRYDIFKASKPGMKYKDIRLRNSGNDFFFSMMRDALSQSIVMHRMDIDLQAYEPAVLYLNGAYYGIMNLREVTSKDYMYSNYGIENEDIVINENVDYSRDPAYTPLSNYISGNDITRPEVYQKVCEMMDMEEFINYHIAQIFEANTDWPWNNVKIWKKKTDGKWRWIMYDTDMTFNFKDNQQNYNTLLYALGEHPTDKLSDWCNLLIRRLILNQEFQKKFVDRFCVQISTTFATDRVNAIMDSLSGKISEEIILHKKRWAGSNRTLVDDLKLMKIFSAGRPDQMMRFLSNRFMDSVSIQTVHLSSNVPGMTYTMNDEHIMDSELNLNYFNGKQLTLKTNPVFGYNFKHWEVSTSKTLEMVKMGDTWNYFDGNAQPATNWYTADYNDVAWKSGPAQFGYGENQATLISFGDNPNAKYPTSYYRKTLQIENSTSLDSVVLQIFVDDGAVVYFNGKELGRHLMSAAIPTFNTFSTTISEGEYVSFKVPKALLKDGENLIAVEVHQANIATSDCIFDLKMSCKLNDISTEVVTDPVFSQVLSSNMNLKAVFDETDPVEYEKPTVVFNEIVASNDVIRDEYGDKDDYVELYNTGDEDVDIAGMFLTDTPVNPTLVEIASVAAGKTTIPAHGRIILWLDDEPLQGLLHLAFKLGKEGETIVLSRRNRSGQLETIDAVTYPMMEDNVSFSRCPDGAANWIQQDPTFNFTNELLTSTEKAEIKSVDLYPTLITESFTLRNANGLLLTVTDLTGKVVFRSFCNSHLETFSAGFMQPGLYLVNAGSHRFKVLKR